MIRTMRLTDDGQLEHNVDIDLLFADSTERFWLDFIAPTDDEVELLSSVFHFHPLAIEDCVHHVQRAKLEYFDGYQFIVAHSMHPTTYTMAEVDIFFSEKFVVSFHHDELKEMDDAWKAMTATKLRSTNYIVYKILDELVDEYFPPCYQVEDKIARLEVKIQHASSSKMVQKVFEVRSELLALRQVIFPMSDLLYRITESKRLVIQHSEANYFHDVYDHLLRLVTMIDKNRELTADVRDTYLSMNSFKMNQIMMTLTVMTVVFMPLTFIVGVYGMNFDHMPELHWRYGYFIVLAIMVTITAVMLYVFRRKKWL